MSGLSDVSGFWLDLWIGYELYICIYIYGGYTIVRLKSGER